MLWRLICGIHFPRRSLASSFKQARKTMHKTERSCTGQHSNVDAFIIWFVDYMVIPNKITANFLTVIGPERTCPSSFRQWQSIWAVTLWARLHTTPNQQPSRALQQNDHGEFLTSLCKTSNGLVPVCRTTDLHVKRAGPLIDRQNVIEASCPVSDGRSLVQVEEKEILS